MSHSNFFRSVPTFNEHSTVKSTVRSWKIKAVNVINEPTFRTVCRVLDGAVEGVKLFKRGEPWTYFQCVTKIALALVDNLEVDEYMYFEADKTWGCPFSDEFTGLIIRSVANFPTKVLKTSDKGIDIHIVDLGNDTIIGWVVGKGTTNCVWAKLNQFDDVRQRLIEILWSQFENKSIVVLPHRQKRRRNDEKLQTVTDFEVDMLAKSMTSKIAKEQAQYMRLCMEKGIKRSILYYGPPGTGKTTMVQTAVNVLGLKSFRLTADDLGRCEAHVIYDAIDIFKPDVVIIDDIDRTGLDAYLFDLMACLKEKVKFILATANRPSRLDEGILRPGRFDELIPIMRLDDEVTKFILGEEYASAFEDVKDFPIAYIEEYKTQRQLKSHEEATQILVELQNRVKRLSEYYKEFEVNDDGSLSISSKRVGTMKKRSRRRTHVPTE